MQRPASTAPGGFTLIELLLVVTIVAILATVAFPLFGYFREKARDVSCIGNLRMLYSGVSSHLLDNDMKWPQTPEADVSGTNEEPLWKWWFETLRPYGVAKHHWVCPSEASTYTEQYYADDEFHSSYIPTDFEATPNIAYMWASQPWFIERGEFHGRNHGPNIIFPDGTVRQGPALMPK